MMPSEQLITISESPPLPLRNDGGNGGDSEIPPPFLNHHHFEKGIYLTFDNIEYVVNKNILKKCIGLGNKKLLNGVSGTFNEGELVALMGPSGAGKSTLMNVLSGYETSNMTNGNVKLMSNRVELDIKKLSCYIPQDDHFLPQLTVMETMLIAANMKIPKRVSFAEKKRKVEENLTNLGLSLELKDTKCDNLSGGQKKRLSIAQELFHELSLILLDEPTSGLDSTTAFEVMQTLDRMAKQGKIIVCTIHQPSAKVFQLFSRLYLLHGGYCIYNDAARDLKEYLKSHDIRNSVNDENKSNYDIRSRLTCPNDCNRVDFVMEIAGNAYGKGILHKMGENQKHVAMILPAANNYKSATCNWPERVWSACDITRFTTLLLRTLKCVFTDMYLLLARLGIHSIVGLLIGTIYVNIGNDGNSVQDNSTCIFMTLLFIMLSSMMLPILSFPAEMDVLVRQSFNSWFRLFPYYAAKTVIDIPFEIIFTLVFSTFVYWMTDQPKDDWRFETFAALCFLLALAAQSIGLTLGGCFSMKVGISTGVFMVTIFLLFSGFFVQIKNIPVVLRWISDLSLIHYAYEGSFLIIYGFDRARLVCKDPTSPLCITDPQIILKTHNVESTLPENIKALIIYVCIARFIGFVALQLRILLKHKGIIDLFKHMCSEY